MQGYTKSTQKLFTIYLNTVEKVSHKGRQIVQFKGWDIERLCDDLS